MSAHRFRPLVDSTRDVEQVTLATSMDARYACSVTMIDIKTVVLKGVVTVFDCNLVIFLHAFTRFVKVSVYTGGGPTVLTLRPFTHVSQFVLYFVLSSTGNTVWFPIKLGEQFYLLLPGIHFNIM